MTKGKLRIGTRESQLATWQATQVKDLLGQHGIASELVLIKSEGDIDLVTPLYEIGVQGVFTRSLDAALLSNKIDLAVHSLKDVPTQPASGISQAAVLKRGPANDLLVFKDEGTQAVYLSNEDVRKRRPFHIATSSIRRKAQWLNKYPDDIIHNLRGNVNTRLSKLQSESRDAAIFAQAGLERIGLRPMPSMILDWMLPAPAQGAIVVVCRSGDRKAIAVCMELNDGETEMCTRIEREFLRRLSGGCSTPISALACVRDDSIYFRGNILSLDGHDKIEIEKSMPLSDVGDLGKSAAEELLEKGGEAILNNLRHASE